jgi:2-phosphoglycerate kinase
MKKKPSLKWKVLLIGGNSGTGKTTVSRQLAQRFGVGLAEVDDFRLVIERMSTVNEQPAIHNLISIAANLDQTTASLSAALIEVAKTMSEALEIVIANHVNTNTPLILEGDGLTPRLASRGNYAGLDTQDYVRAVFLIEQDENQLLQNALARKRGFDGLSEKAQKERVHQDWLYGQWLQTEAHKYGVPIMAPCPWQTLAARITNAIG